MNTLTSFMSVDIDTLNQMLADFAYDHAVESMNDTTLRFALASYLGRVFTGVVVDDAMLKSTRYHRSDALTSGM